MDEDSPPPTYTHHRHRSSRHVKAEKSLTSCRRKKEKNSRHDENYYAQGRNPKPEHKRRDRSTKKCGKVSRSRTNNHAASRPRTPPVDISSSSEEEIAYRLDRRELRAALKRDIPKPKVDSSSLKRKLLGVQQSVTEFLASKVDEEQEESELTASLEIMELLETLSDQNIITGLSYSSKNDSKSDKLIENIVPLVSAAMPTALEEQELRLAVLKSAIIKKHENRKKRRVIEARPYSPTDTDILLDNSEQLFVDTKVVLDNMEISPAVSPELPDKILLSVDMDIASDVSRSPIYLHEPNPPLCFDAANDQWIPLPPDGICQDDITNFSIFQQHSTLLAPPPPAPPEIPVDYNAMDIALSSVEDEEEDALRALLLSDQKFKKNKLIVPVDVEPTKSDVVDSDADDLRALVLESIRKKSEPKKMNTMITLKNAVARLNSIHKQVHLESVDTNLEPQLHSINEPISRPQMPANVVRPTTPPMPIRTLITIVPNDTKTAIPVATTQKSEKPPKRRISETCPADDLPEAPPTSIAPDSDATTIPPIKKTRRSALLINPVFKPVRPVIIRLTPGGSSSSEEDADDQDLCEAANAAIGSNSLDRFYDPSSPSSIVMDSPAYAPSSPSHVIEMGDSTGINDANNTLHTPSTAFQHKLDEYLRSVRRKNSLPANTPATTPKSPITISLKPKQPSTPLVCLFFYSHSYNFILPTFTKKKYNFRRLYAIFPSPLKSSTDSLFSA